MLLQSNYRSKHSLSAGPPAASGISPEPSPNRSFISPIKLSTGQIGGLFSGCRTNVHLLVVHLRGDVLQAGLC